MLCPWSWNETLFMQMGSLVSGFRHAVDKLNNVARNQWHQSTDAGERLGKLSLTIPNDVQIVRYRGVSSRRKSSGWVQQRLLDS